MADCGCEFEATNDEQRKTLRLVLGINAIMFLVEITAGVLTESTGLAADSLDMLADASVYAVSLYAVGRAASVKRTAATASGVLQITLGVGVLIEACRRFFFGGDPVGLAMVAMGCVALPESPAPLIRPDLRNAPFTVWLSAAACFRFSNTCC